MMISETELKEYVSQQLQDDPSHDVLHIHRVVNNAKRIAVQERAISMDVVVAAAWLHDLVQYDKNSSLRSAASTHAASQARDYLRGRGMDENFVEDTCHAIEAHSFSAGIKARTLEAKVVQDADRLDSLGAIGVIRTFVAGAKFGAAFYSENEPWICETRELNDKAFILDHFQEKLFRLEDLMHTQAAKAEAKKRVEYMKLFVNELLCEIKTD